MSTGMTFTCLRRLPLVMVLARFWRTFWIIALLVKHMFAKVVELSLVELSRKIWGFQTSVHHIIQQHPIQKTHGD